MGVEDLETISVRSNATREDLIDLFRLDWDATTIEARIMELGPEMAPYLGSLSGLRLLKPADAVELFYSFLCTPNNNLSRITQMVRHLASRGAVMDEHNGQPIHRFPGSEVIAAIPPAELRARAFGYRGDTIPSIAAQVVARGGDDWIVGLRDVPYEEAHAKLCELKGIGPKLADCICLFAHHHTVAAPIDTHVWQAATRLYFPELKGKALTDMRYRQVSEFLRGRFGALTGWAHQYLFYDNLLNWRTRKSAPPFL